MKLGWEFMGHNKTNTTRLTALPANEERELIRYCTKRLTEATGKTPVGWLGSGLAETWNTLDYLVEDGYLYVSDWVNDDQPYRMKRERQGARLPAVLVRDQRFGDRSTTASRPARISARSSGTRSTCSMPKARKSRRA